nr:EOG090X0D00 [Daphnia sinensis]
MHPTTKPTSEEIAVAKWIKANVPCKKTKFLSHSVEYFTASKAVDKLLTSPWSSPGKNKEEPLFTTRESVVQYLDLLLRKKFFHRARKIPVSEQELKARSKKKEKKKEKEDGGKKEKQEAEEEKKGDDGESSHAEEKKDKGKKEKRKIRLDMHLEQIFVDGNDAYVWIYDPIPYYYWLAGGGVVLAVVALCLFPLWPPVVRKGVYYLSIGAAGFLMFIFGLAVLRVLIFCLLWLVSMGRHHLWIFPNLTEDVGFFASFWPLWKLTICGNLAVEKTFNNLNIPQDIYSSPQQIPNGTLFITNVTVDGDVISSSGDTVTLNTVAAIMLDDCCRCSYDRRGRNH